MVESTSSQYPNTTIDTLKAALDVHRLVFNAAVDCVPARDIESVETRKQFLNLGAAVRIPTTTFKIWERDTCCVDNAVPNGLDPLFPRAFRKWNLCERACWMVKDSVRHLLQPTGLQVSWALVNTLPKWVLSHSYECAVRVPNHSVLLVSGPGYTNEFKVMDLTIEQFG
jgi:hypothetical protein